MHALGDRSIDEWMYSRMIKLMTKAPAFGWIIDLVGVECKVDEAGSDYKQPPRPTRLHALSLAD